MQFEVPVAPDDAGMPLRQLLSPAFAMTYPRLDNRNLIPPDVLAVSEGIWRTSRFEERPVEFRLFDDVFVVEEGLVFTSALQLVAESRTQHDDQEVARGRSAIVQSLARGDVPRLEGTCVLCKKRGEGTYGHWLLEMFPKAVLASESLDVDDLRCIVPAATGRLGTVIDNCMGWLGIDGPARVSLGTSPVRVHRLVMVNGLTAHGAYMSPLAVAAVRRFAGTFRPGPDRALYVSRGSVGHRMLHGEDAILPRMRAAGVVPFDPGLADLATQVAAFAGASRVVGVMGSALTNIVFARPGTDVVILTPANMPDVFFWFIAGLCGLRYREIRCPLAGPAGGNAPWDGYLMLPEAAMAELFPPQTANPPAQAPELPLASPVSGPPTQVYRQISLDELAADSLLRLDHRERVERLAYLSEARLDLPVFAFGDTGLTSSRLDPSQRNEAKARSEYRPPVHAYLLRNAVVHGTLGLVSVDDAIVGETLAHLPLHLLPGAAREGPTRLRLPVPELSATLPAAYHLLACNQQNYFHWMMDALSRFDLARFRAIGTADEAPGGAVLLVPHMDVFWKWESLNTLVPAEIPRMALAGQGRFMVQRLLLVPDLSGGGFLPHPALLAAFDTIAAAVLGAAAAAAPYPGRRLYIARTDSRNRTLANERDLISRLERAGFTAVVPGTMPLSEQVRLFATASHIVAGHGAGLTNIAYCRPGARLCELHPEGYVNWTFRRLAALRGMAYGCLLGETVERRSASPHDDLWRIDLDAVEAVLGDPRFIG